MSNGASILRRGLLLTPTVAILGISLAWPLYSILLRSLNERGRAEIDGGFYWGHYIAIAQDELLRQVTVHSVMLALVSTLICAALAFPAAYAISRMSKTASSLMMILLLMPFWVSIIVRLFAFTTFLGQFGIINGVASSLGFGPWELLYNTFAVVVGMVAYLLPYMVLILLSAMAAVDTSLLSVARTMGTSERRIFVDIYFPQVRPALVGGMVLIFVLGLGFFLTPAILGGPRNLTIPVFIQQQVQAYQWGKAAAMGIVLLAVSVIGYLIALKTGGRGLLSPMQSGSRGTAAPDPLRLTPTGIFCLVVLVVDLAVLILPLLVVLPTAVTETTQLRFPPVGFTWRWFAEVISSPLWREAFLMSIRIGLITAVVSTLSGMALARVGTRTASPAAQTAIQAMAIMPLIVPVILLAIGIYDVQGQLDLLGTDLGLVLAHSVLCLPLTFLVMANGLASVDQSIEQAAWSMGAHRTRTFFQVVLPNLLPAVLGALVIAFVTSWDEAVLAMFQTQFEKTLPVTIYSFLRSGITPAVSAAAALIIVPACLGSLIVALRLLRQARKIPQTS